MFPQLASTKQHWGNDLLDSVAFRWLLIDEATQATEPATLIPIARTEEIKCRSDGSLMASIWFLDVSCVDQRKCRRKRSEKLPSFGRMHHQEVVSDREPNKIVKNIWSNRISCEMLKVARFCACSETQLQKAAVVEVFAESAPKNNCAPLAELDSKEWSTGVLEHVGKMVCCCSKASVWCKQL